MNDEIYFPVIWKYKH